MRQVLFVCSGNIFRSLTAEHALRHVLGNHRAVLVSSAGTEDRMCTVDPVVSDYLRSRGIDVSGHHRRTLTAEMLQPSVTVIAMSTDHRDFIARQFARHGVPLFTQACGLPPAPLLDVHEVIVDPDSDPVGREAYVHRTIDRILQLTPQLASRLIGSMAAEGHDEMPADTRRA